MELLPLRFNSTPALSDLLPLTVYSAGTEIQPPLTRMIGLSAHQLFLTISGPGKFRRSGAEKDKWEMLSGGDLLYIPADCAHEYMAVGKEPWHVAYVTFLENFGNLMDGWGFRDVPRILKIRDIPALADRVREIWHHSGSYYDPWRTSKTLLELMLDIVKTIRENSLAATPAVLPVNYRDSALETAAQFLRDHMHRPITIVALAEHVGYSQKQLTRLFRISLGATPLQYLHSLRLHAAIKLLDEHPDLTIRQVAAYVGMEPANFTRLYKRAFHELPSRKSRS